MEEIDRYAVFGNPIAHSLSPRMHQWYAEKTHQKMSYEAILGDPLKFEYQVREFLLFNGGSGCNITAPFKIRAFGLAEEVSERCRLAQSCNTLMFRKDGVLYGDNTDGVGLLADLNRLKWIQPRTKILILGCGGATRGILYPLLKAGASVYLWNRTLEKAKNLVRDFQSFGEIHYYPNLNQVPEMDLVINALPLQNEEILSILGARVFHSSYRFYDLQYRLNGLTPFLQQARSLQTHLLPVSFQDGLGMLFAQGAESFRVWRGFQVNPFALLAQYR